MTTAGDLLAINDLKVSFDTLDGRADVLRGIGIRLGAGERVAIVGESGCGKSVTARAILGLLPRRIARLSGSIRFEGIELAGLPGKAMRRLRGRAITMIFQDPTAALNPMFRIRDQFQAVVGRRGDAGRRMRDALVEVAIDDPDRVLDSYSFQLSGGMTQRVMIAMGLANQPRLVIADEPGTALDVTVQEQTLRLMHALSDSHGTAIVLISHNLGVVRRFAHRVYVMYAGRILEEAPVGRLFERPRHPYTQALLAAVPRLGADRLPVGIDGNMPDFRAAMPGCPLQPRCKLATSDCSRPFATVEPVAGHRVACIDAAAVTP